MTPTPGGRSSVPTSPPRGRDATPSAAGSWAAGIPQHQGLDDIDLKLRSADVVLALLLVYLVMAALFESLLHPFAIMLALPFAFVGIAWICLLAGSPFNLMAQIGLLILIGIVVNNCIVLVYRAASAAAEGRRPPTACCC